MVEMTASYESRTRYAYRYSLLSRARLLQRLGELDEALALSETAIRLAAASGDVWLYHLVVLSKAELLDDEQREGETLEAMEGIALSVAAQPPDVYALYQRALACRLEKLNQPA